MAKKIESELDRKHREMKEEFERKDRQTVEEIANNISRLAESVRAIIGGRLKRKAIIILLASSARLPQSTVEQVLVALESLEKDWLNK